MSAVRPDPPPFVDEHALDVAAPPAVVWPVLCARLDASFSRPLAARYSRLVGVTDPTSSGPRPLAPGSTFPGFHVVTATPGEELALAGAHRFSAYGLRFLLTPSDPSGTSGTTDTSGTTGTSGTHLRALTHATFPGPAGALYRTLVISSGFHAAGLHRLLTGVRRAAERAWTT